MNKSKGFTLIEVVIAISISLLLFLTVSGFVYYFYRTTGYNLNQIAAINSARKGMEIMVREIREATYSDNGAFPIQEIATQSFTFFSDIDKDDNIERVRYFLDGSLLKKGVLQATGDPLQYLEENEEIKILSRYVRNSNSAIFTYYDESNNVISDLSDLSSVNLVQLELVINTDANRPPEEFSLISNAQLRNLRID
ncbi:MAG: prepilin-type N-terminal cleavage/methylation domain-containing protein [Candidatus Portnoybacteria bacterium]|nr:prepilin-type N-terminal cleavage/methylation domain-containing protein [Candidatus Portnoybacteria bacterium]